MLKVGFVGWRGMVGSVLMKRMLEEKDFANIEATFFSTSQVDSYAPNYNPRQTVLKDAYAIDELAKLDCIVTTQGSDYTHEVWPKLRNSGWNGYWIDAASALRMDENALIILDPINGDKIEHALNAGIKNYIGGNCTVSLMLLALDGLFKADLIEWISAMTYQAASGAGANNIRELLEQSGHLYNSVTDMLNDKSAAILDIDNKVTAELNSSTFPKQYFGVPLAGNVIPWIDAQMPNGQTKEEWKGSVETNKILGLPPDTVKVEGLCVRVGVVRSHSQALTIKLKQKGLTTKHVSDIVANANSWIKVVANNKDATLENLTPAAVSGTLNIAVGRIKQLKLGEEYFALFTVGDQLLWGAAEPLRRMVNILVRRHV